jgi:hypothetical protein
MSCAPWVLDASSIIQIKLDVPRSKQWATLRGMEDLVVAGGIAIPREVAREVKAYAHPDAPGVWMHGVESKLGHPVDPPPAALTQVLAVAQDVVDPNKAIDGDPYVLALAHDLMARGHKATVVTEDVNDNAIRIAVATACGRLGIKCVRLADFLQAEGL